jgi:hypothetical protein
MGWPRWIAPNGALRLHRAQERFELIDLHVERVTGMATQNERDVFVELSVLLAQGRTAMLMTGRMYCSRCT